MTKAIYSISLLALVIAMPAQADELSTGEKAIAYGVGTVSSCVVGAVGSALIVGAVAGLASRNPKVGDIAGQTAFYTGCAAGAGYAAYSAYQEEAAPSSTELEKTETLE